jgi:ABC-type multidrug transport system ATPase subunit
MLEMLRAEREVTVLLCTHDMDEAAALCDRVLMMNEGRVLADGSPQELCRGYGVTSLEDVFMHLTGKTFTEGDREEVET